MLVCDVIVTGPNCVWLRIAESALSLGVASLLAGDDDACSDEVRQLRDQARIADVWLQRDDPPSAAGLPHGHALNACFTSARAGEHYLSFVRGSALLERLLNDLVAASKSGGDANSSSGGGVLLKDLIAHPEVVNRLGADTAAAFHVLFSPRALNLRNLVWHGFLRPHELDRRWVALLLRLLWRVAEAVRDVRASEQASNRRPTAPLTYWSPLDAEEQLAEALPLLDAPPALPHPPAHGHCAAVLCAPFCCVGFATPLRHALAAYARRDYAAFACLALPALEAGLRAAFVIANPTEHALAHAHLGAYFSTLDGYGQRAKHQLLLVPTLHANGRVNRLPHALGRGVYALLLDLVLHAAGPSLRAKYAHGEAELAALPPCVPTESVEAPAAMRLLHAALLALCAASHTEASGALLAKHAPADATRLDAMHAAAARLQRGYTSLCDPLVRLGRARARVCAAVGAALADGRRYSWTSRQPSSSCEEGIEEGMAAMTEEDDGICVLTVPSPHGTDGVVTLAVACVVRPSDQGVLTRAAELHAHVEAALAALGEGNAAAATAADACPGSQGSACDDGRTDTGGGDGDGFDLGAEVECSRWGLLAGCERFCALECRRLAELAERVASRSASTAQRRTYVLMCHATLALRRVVALALTLGDRQPLRTVAAGASTAPSEVRDSAAKGGGRGGSSSGMAVVPLPRLHSFVEGMVALHEGGKGVDAAVASGLQFVRLALVRRAIASCARV